MKVSRRAKSSVWLDDSPYPEWERQADIRLQSLNRTHLIAHFLVDFLALEPRRRLTSGNLVERVSETIN